MISNEEELVMEVKSLEDSYYISQIIDDKDSFLIHGETDSKMITAVAYLSRRKMNIMATPYSEIVAFGTRRLFYKEHFPSLDIKFRCLILNFTDITSWITPHDIIFPENGNSREVWRVDINDNCLIKFMYPRTFLKGGDVTIRVKSPKRDRSFEELLQESNTIQDFLNFVITKDRVLTKSIMGVIGNPDKEKLVK
jgi:hypothetical protein